MEARNNKKGFKVTKLSANKLVFDNALRMSKLNQKQAGTVFIAKFLKSEPDDIVYYPVIFDDKLSDPSVLQMSGLVRDNLQVKENDFISPELVCLDGLTIIDASKVSFTVRRLDDNKDELKQIKARLLTDLFLSHFSHFPLCIGQDLVLEYGSAKLVLSIDAIHGSQSSHIYQVTPDTILNINLSPFSDVSLQANSFHNESTFRHALFPPKPKAIEFNVKGVGGHKKELEKILLQVFYSRMLAPDLADAYGVKHTKGILLYGAPGTGKTHIGRAIAAMFPRSHVKVINGPELKSKFVGESPENVRNIFAEARAEWEEKGKDSDIHVFIFDEIDAQAPVRGMTTGTHAEDDMTTQLLTVLDGVDAIGNIIVIGTTNRKELIDPALLRPGRLDIHIEIGLPDEAGRLEILSIKSETMRNEKLLDDKVDLAAWAKDCKNFTGAELEQLVKNAVHYAMEGNLELQEGNKNLVVKKDLTKALLAKVKNEHFHRAFQDILPAFGVDKSCQELTRQFVIYNDVIKATVDRFISQLMRVEKSKQLNGFRLLLSGESGVGKTSLALYLAALSGVNYVKVISVDKLLALPLNKQLSFLDEELENAQRVPFSIIILDDLESLLSADADLTSYNNLLRLKIESFLKAISTPKNKCVLIATTSHLDFVRRTHLLELFNEREVVSPIQINDIKDEKTFSTLLAFCDLYGYKILPSTRLHDDREMNLPVRELIYQIKKFCSNEGSEAVLDLDAFLSQIVSTQCGQTEPRALTRVTRENVATAAARF